jgi:hypothetical protein
MCKLNKILVLYVLPQLGYTEGLSLKIMVRGRKFLIFPLKFQPEF